MKLSNCGIDRTREFFDFISKINIDQNCSEYSHSTDSNQAEKDSSFISNSNKGRNVSSLSTISQNHSQSYNKSANSSTSFFSSLVFKSSSTDDIAQFNSQSTKCRNILIDSSLKLTNLKKLVKQKGVFNDNSPKIHDLNYCIKKQIVEAESEIKELVKFETSLKNKKLNSNLNSHFSNSIHSLKTTLIELARDFKSTLETNTENIKKQIDRRNMYSFSERTLPGGAIFDRGNNPSSSCSYRKNVGGGLTSFDPDLESGSGVQMQQLTKKDPKFLYSSLRSDGIEQVQRLIGELGEIYQKVALMIDSQKDSIMRIDHDVDKSLKNIVQGQNELLTVFNRISSSRSIILKIFAILILFIIFFVIFLK